MSNENTDFDLAQKAERLPERKERILTFHNLSEKQKSLLSAAGVGAAGISLGVVAMALMGTTNIENEDPIEAINPDLINPKSASVKIFTDAPFAEGVNDSMSFNEAFAAARKEVGVGGVFEWKGKLFNTFQKHEWDAMSPEDKINFYSSIDQKFIPGDETRDKEIIDILNDKEIVDSIDDNEDIVIIQDNPVDPLDPDFPIYPNQEDIVDIDNELVYISGEDFYDDKEGFDNDVAQGDESLEDDFINSADDF